MTILPLNKVPSNEWQAEYDGLLAKNGWLKNKIDRQKRLKEHYDYIEKYCPELRGRGKGWVIDIGPGPGEFLEYARFYNNKVLGVDASDGYGGMGNDYLRYSQLMTKRQRLDVEYIGFEQWLNERHSLINGAVRMINSRGSLEQALSRHMLGEPHHVHHQCRMLTWNMTAALMEMLMSMFGVFARMLRPGGCILFVCNGASNDLEFESYLIQAAEKVGQFQLMFHPSKTEFKWMRV